MTEWIVAGGAGDAGCEHGLPPGVTEVTWPRHRRNGMPLVHGFTVRVPAAYRARGADNVALSYFHPGDSESFYPKPALRTRIEALSDGAPLEGDERDSAFFRAIAEHAKAAQPNTQRFTDLLGHTHAIVWHTEATLAGPRCPRPSEELPQGIVGKAMFLDEPVRDASPLSFATTEPERPYIQFGTPLHWVQAEVDGFGEMVLEIEDGVGGANYGSGNCQIDLENGLLDWAC